MLQNYTDYTVCGGIIQITRKGIVICEKKYITSLIELMGTHSNYFIDILFIVCSLTFAVCVFIIYTNLISFIFDLERTFCNM